MDLGPLPMRGFPTPNPGVAGLEEFDTRARRWNIAFAVVALLTGLASVLFCVMIGLAVAPGFREAGSIYILPAGLLLLALIVLGPTMLYFVFKARMWNAIASRDVIPVRLLSTKGRVIDGCWTILLVLLTLPLNFLVNLVLSGLFRGGRMYKVAMLRDYRVVNLRLRMPSDTFTHVSVGQVVWIVPPRKLRMGFGWCEEEEHLGQRCLVHGQVYDWFLTAEARAHRTAHRPRRKRLRAIARARKRRLQYR